MTSPFSQQQFLDVVTRDEAMRRFRDCLDWTPLGEQSVALSDALGRVLASDVKSPVDVPSFDRSNFDGFAVQAADTYGAEEETPRSLKLMRVVSETGSPPTSSVETGAAMAISTGGMLPRGADAVVMVEHTDVADDRLLVRKPVAPGAGVTFAGTDIARGETILRAGQRLTSRETGVLAAVGLAEARVWRAVRVAILSTGDEIIAPGDPMRPGQVYDSNARILADAVRELGAEATCWGITRDSLAELREKVAQALETSDVVLLSGGTSKGAGDLSYRVVAEFDDPGIVAHGVALKPGKPICLSATRGKAVVVLPGFPTSAIFTFHEFVAPLILALGGRDSVDSSQVEARLASKVNSEIGRTEYLLVGLVHGDAGLVAYPMGKGSGSVTTFSRADGFITVPREVELIDADMTCDVRLLGRALKLPDVVVMGSHCLGLDYLLGLLQSQGWQTKFMAIGSTAGLEAARRGECDIAGVHLLDPKTGEYNRPFLTPELHLARGYGRKQGVVFRRDDRRFIGKSAEEAVQSVIEQCDCQMVNRNQGSGTRILIDGLLQGAQPPGYGVQATNHHAVAAAVAQGRADWGVAIAPVADQQGLGFLPLTDEEFDFVIPKSRVRQPAVDAFMALLNQDEVRAKLRRILLIE